MSLSPKRSFARAARGEEERSSDRDEHNARRPEAAPAQAKRSFCRERKIELNSRQQEARTTYHSKWMKRLGNGAAGLTDSLIETINLAPSAINAAGYWSGLSRNADAVPYIPTLAKLKIADENSPFYNSGYYLGEGAQMFGTGGLGAGVKLAGLGVKTALKTGAKAIGRRGLTGSPAPAESLVAGRGLTGSLAPAASVTAGRGLSGTLKTAVAQTAKGIAANPLQKAVYGGTGGAFLSPAMEQQRTGRAGTGNIIHDAAGSALVNLLMPIKPGEGGGGRLGAAARDYAGKFSDYLNAGFPRGGMFPQPAFGLAAAMRGPRKTPGAGAAENNWAGKLFDHLAPGPADIWRAGKGAQISKILGQDIVPKFTEEAPERNFNNLDEMNTIVKDTENPANVRYSDRKYDVPGARSTEAGINTEAQKLANPKPGESKPKTEAGLSVWDLRHNMQIPPKTAKQTLTNARQLRKNATEYADFSEIVKDKPLISTRTANIYRSQPITKDGIPIKGMDKESLINVNPEKDFVTSYPQKEMLQLKADNTVPDILAVRNLADFGAQATSDVAKRAAARLIRNMLYNKNNERDALKKFFDEPTLMHIEASLSAGENAPLGNRNIAYLWEKAAELRKRFPNSPAAGNLEAEIMRMLKGFGRE